MTTEIKKPLVYLILGAAGSGRREIVADLAEGGLLPEDRAAVLLEKDEPPEECDGKLPGLERWSWTDGFIVGSLPEDATHVFFVTHGRANPVDQIEAFNIWVDAQGGALGRVLCVVDCALLEKNSGLMPWYEACIHFSDAVLLGRREGVANKWVSDFLEHFKKMFLPCLFELVKGGRVKNPPLILEPQALRISHFFDEDQDWVFTDAEGEEIDEQEETDDEEEVEAAPEEDPYLTRDAAGRRAKRIPDISRYLKG